MPVRDLAELRRRPLTDRAGTPVVPAKRLVDRIVELLRIDDPATRMSPGGMTAEERRTLLDYFRP
jgi:hypothetical protein